MHVHVHTHMPMHAHAMHMHAHVYARARAHAPSPHVMPRTVARKSENCGPACHSGPQLVPVCPADGSSHGAARADGRASAGALAFVVRYGSIVPSRPVVDPADSLLATIWEALWRRDDPFAGPLAPDTVPYPQSVARPCGPQQRPCPPVSASFLALHPQSLRWSTLKLPEASCTASQQPNSTSASDASSDPGSDAQRGPDADPDPAFVLRFYNPRPRPERDVRLWSFWALKGAYWSTVSEQRGAPLRVRPDSEGRGWWVEVGAVKAKQIVTLELVLHTRNSSVLGF